MIDIDLGLRQRGGGRCDGRVGNLRRIGALVIGQGGNRVLLAQAVVAIERSMGQSGIHFLVFCFTNLAPIWSPLIQESSQRR